MTLIRWLSMDNSRWTTLDGWLSMDDFRWMNPNDGTKESRPDLARAEVSRRPPSIDWDHRLLPTKASTRPPLYPPWMLKIGSATGSSEVSESGWSRQRWGYWRWWWINQNELLFCQGWSSIPRVCCIHWRNSDEGRTSQSRQESAWTEVST